MIPTSDVTEKIALAYGDFGNYLICRVLNPDAGEGNYDWNEENESDTILVQVDFDFPSLAITFGWTGSNTDINGAAEYLDECIATAKVAEDPGYFV